jgi:hypothetical protein
VLQAALDPTPPLGTPAVDPDRTPSHGTPAVDPLDVPTPVAAVPLPDPLLRPHG